MPELEKSRKTPSSPNVAPGGPIFYVEIGLEVLIPIHAFRRFRSFRIMFAIKKLSRWVGHFKFLHPSWFSRTLN